MAPRFVPAVRRVLERTGLFGPVFWMYRALREWSPALERRNRALRRSAGVVPLPPTDLVFAVTASRDLGVFVDTGRAAQAEIQRAAEEVGLSIERTGAILDFGCGCGRVLRHWADVVPAGVLHGSDYNARAIAWVSAHLPFVRAGTNRLAPPLEYADGTFDLVYALSVFTHLTLELEAQWLRELERILKPGGVLLLTLQGDGYRGKFTAEERAAYDAGHAVVRQESLAGTNWCATFHPEPYVRRVFAERLELLRYRSGPDAMPGVPWQDLVVLRKPNDGAGGT